MSNQTEILFVLGDKLPLVSEAVLAILSYAPGGSPKKSAESKTRRNGINAYVRALRNLWIRAFGEEYICSTKTIADRLRKFLSSYFNQVTCNRRSTMSKRERIHKWRCDPESNELLDILKLTANPEIFEEAEKIFYYGQKGKDRTGYISEEIDFAYEDKKSEDAARLKADDESFEEELSFIEGDETTILQSSFMDISDLQLFQSHNRSGTVSTRKSIDNKQTQTINIQPDRPVIRKVKKFTDDIKATCAKVSSDCGISVEKSRIAVQTTCKILYHHNFYLSTEEQVGNEPRPTSTTCESSADFSEEPPNKHPRVEGQ